METKATKKPLVTLVRGDSLNPWEGKLWESLMADFEVRAICSKKNLYPISAIQYPITKLKTTSDIKLLHKLNMIALGRIQHMHGLEVKLHSVQIAHTAELYHTYTYQAARAKKENPDLKLVVTIWDNSFGRFEFMHIPASVRKKYYERIAYVVENVDMVLPVSSSAEALAREYGVPEKKIRMITPAIISTTVQESIDDRNDIYMVNRLVKEKGIYDVLYGWKLFVESGGKGTLNIIGKGPERKHMESLVRMWKLENKVLFLGSLANTEVRRAFVGARALVIGSLPMPLWQEQFGYVLAEAMMAGCPVIAAASGAIPEVVGEGGILVQPGAPWDIAKALHTLSGHQTFEKLSLQAKNEARRFSAERFARELTDVYDALV